MKPINKTYKAYSAILLVFFVASSCKKLLEIPPNPSDRITASQAFADSANVVSVMAGIYTSFDVVDNASWGIHNGGLSVYTGLSADELINNEISAQSIETPFYTNSLLPANGAVSYFWSNAYTSLYKIHAAMAGIASSTGLSADLKNKLTAELKTVRALYYFNMVNLYGGVPLVTGTDYHINIQLPRLSPDKVYELIVSDLEAARKNLTPDYPSEGHSRPNLYTATALLAKVNLYLSNWQKAADLAGEVIDEGGYSLETDLNNVFLQGSTEAIWQLPAVGQFSQTNEGLLLVPTYPETIPHYEFTTSFLDALEPDDQRKINWIGSVDVNGQTYFYPYKYKNNYADPGLTTEDYMIFRLSDQYLIRAEARAQLNQFNDALEDINTVRRRAGLTDLSFSDKETLIAAILHERRVEFFTEWGNRWFDLKRTNTANTILGGAKPTWQPHDALYPIPLDQMEKNPFLVQNPGY